MLNMDPVLRPKECFDDLTYAETCFFRIYLANKNITYCHISPPNCRVSWSSCGMPSRSLHLALFLDCRTHHNFWGFLGPEVTAALSFVFNIYELFGFEFSLASGCPHFRGFPGQQGFCRKKTIKGWNNKKHIQLFKFNQTWQDENVYINGGFIRKIAYKQRMFHVWLPEGNQQGWYFDCLAVGLLFLFMVPHSLDDDDQTRLMFYLFGVAVCGLGWSWRLRGCKQLLLFRREQSCIGWVAKVDFFYKQSMA